MNKHNALVFIGSFFAALILCAAAISSVYLFPLQNPKTEPIVKQYTCGNTDDGCAIMADEFAKIIGYPSFNEFILDTRSITDKSLTQKPPCERNEAVAKILKYASFQKLYFETVQVFNIKHPASSLITNEKVYSLDGETVFHNEYCLTVAQKRGKINTHLSKEKAIIDGFSPCTDCYPPTTGD